MRTFRIAVLAALFGAVPAASVLQASQAIATDGISDVTYATVNGKALRLDLYMPPGVARPPLVVWVHGGAWSGGVKTGYPLPVEYTQGGFALAAIEFRLSSDAPFPAPVYDIKAAIRFLRAKSQQYGYRADRIVLAGDSSGGHLAVFVGVTNGEKEFEGNVGGYFDQSSAVQGIIDYYGATDLTTIVAQSRPYERTQRIPSLELFLGGPIDETLELAKTATPIFHLDADDPPLLILHGDQDFTIPLEQSYELLRAYEEAGLRVNLDVIKGAGHSGPPFFDKPHIAEALKFLKEILAP